MSRNRHSSRPTVVLEDERTQGDAVARELASFLQQRGYEIRADVVMPPSRWRQFLLWLLRAVVASVLDAPALADLDAKVAAVTKQVHQAGYSTRVTRRWHDANGYHARLKQAEILNFAPRAVVQLVRVATRPAPPPSKTDEPSEKD